ncbi:TPA: hypothetical protein ENS27_13270 [bacterium]|nr:hypothetical protein [bacterium]
MSARTVLARRSYVCFIWSFDWLCIALLWLWSKVFALDLFSYIKEHRLLNPEVGRRYTQKVLGKGGSCDSNVLLKDFLGCAPSDQAFLVDLGL